MHDLWAFLLQTISLSMTACLLLAVKALLADKLSPRWQYGVWGVLALRAVLPLAAGRQLLLPVALPLETVKAVVERGLSSAYSAVYTATSVSWPIPILTGRPGSITDWAFALYAAGAVVTAAWYLLSYLRLRSLLRRSTAPGQALQEKIEAVCESYGLRPCRAVLVEGLPSAFVCGVLRPILALPAQREVDEKVLLHELLHLRYQDAAQSVFWCALRALHWCNPFLRYVLNRVGNDMESLCDQRVLERLEGEERRVYGGILLSMANERYPRAPGTSSLSNGGKNISRRIAAIVRFKRYPRGMALVSVCVAVVLAVPALAGTAAGYAPEDYRPRGDWAFERAMAIARLQRCTTVAGALDTYAKGLMLENGVYIAMATATAGHEALADRMREHNHPAGSFLDGGPELERAASSEGYAVYNLEQHGPERYSAFLALPVAGDAPDGGSVLIPVTVRWEDGWVVEEGERKTFPETNVRSLLHADKEGLPALREYHAAGRSGTVTLRVDSMYTVDNQVPNGAMSLFGQTAFDGSVKPDAEFGYYQKSRRVEYRFGGTGEERASLTRVALQTVELSAPGAAPVYPEKMPVGDSEWSNNQGASGASRIVTPDWDGRILSGGGTGGTWDGELVAAPPGYAVRVFWNGVWVEEFLLEGGE